METHSFRLILARKIGLKPAIVYERILQISIEDEESVLDDGMTWTRLPMGILEQVFPYLSREDIRCSIRKLRNEGLIAVGHYDEDGGSTNWYAAT